MATGEPGAAGDQRAHAPSIAGARRRTQRRRPRRRGPSARINGRFEAPGRRDGAGVARFTRRRTRRARRSTSRTRGSPAGSTRRRARTVAGGNSSRTASAPSSRTPKPPHRYRCSGRRVAARGSQLHAVARALHDELRRQIGGVVHREPHAAKRPGGREVHAEPVARRARGRGGPSRRRDPVDRKARARWLPRGGHGECLRREARAGRKARLVHEQREPAEVPPREHEPARAGCLGEGLGVGQFQQDPGAARPVKRREEHGGRPLVAVVVQLEVGGRHADPGIGQGDAARPAVVRVKPSHALGSDGARQRGTVRLDRGGRGAARGRIHVQLPDRPRPHRAPPRLRYAEMAGGRRRHAKLHPSAPNPLDGPPGRHVERSAVLGQIHQRLPRGPVDGALEPEAPGDLLIRARQPADERDGHHGAQVHLDPLAAALGLAGAPERPADAVRHAAGAGEAVAGGDPGRGHLVDRRADQREPLVHAAERAHAAEREAEAERGEVRFEHRRAPRDPPGGGRRAVDGTREPGTNLLVGVRDDRPARRQDGEHAARGVGIVEPVTTGALEALDGRELRRESGALGRRDGRMEVREAAGQGAGRVEQDERRRQDARAPAVRPAGEERPEERRQRRVQRQEVVGIVIVEAAAVLRHHRDADVGAREGHEGQARRTPRRGRAADGAEGRERRGQVQRAQRDGEPDAQGGLPEVRRHAGHDGPGRPSEEAEMGQDGLEPHRPARRRQRRAVRHAVQPVRQAAERERGQRREDAGDERADAAAQQQERDRREVDEREKVRPEGEPEAPAQEGEQEGGPPASRGGRTESEEEGQGPQQVRERIVIAGLVRPEQEEVGRDCQQDRREERRPRPERIVRQADGQAEDGQREEHGDQLERPGGHPQQPEERRGQVAVQRAHERLPEEVDGELALEHRQAEQSRRRLVVPEARQPEE